MTKRSIFLYLLGIGGLLTIVVIWYAMAFQIQSPPAFGSFNGSRALTDVQIQVAFGPRIPGSEAHARTLDWLRMELQSAGWQTRIQKDERLGHAIQNLIAYREETTPLIILAAHYDSRIYADRDPDLTKRTEPVPGANDGASGVAVLLELARSLPESTVPTWLVFFDAEDNGNIAGWDWILGSKAFVDQLEFTPEAVVVFDMIGDSDQNIYVEGNSDPSLVEEIWASANQLGYSERFIPEQKYSMLDDHTPFLQKGIPAIDIIDFDYPYYHTTADTPDKVSEDSLQAVGETISTWLGKQSSN